MLLAAQKSTAVGETAAAVATAVMRSLSAGRDRQRQHLQAAEALHHQQRELWPDIAVPVLYGGLWVLFQGCVCRAKQRAGNRSESQCYMSV